MRLPQNCGSGLHFPFMSPDMSHSHTTQSPISQPPRHYLVTTVTFLVSLCAQNLQGLQSFFTCIVKKFWSQVLSQIWKVVTISQTSGLLQSVSRTCLPGKGLGANLPGQNVISWTRSPICGKILTRQFL
jgi:hypothetical protein